MLEGPTSFFANSRSGRHRHRHRHRHRRRHRHRHHHRHRRSRVIFPGYFPEYFGSTISLVKVEIGLGTGFPPYHMMLLGWARRGHGWHRK